MSVGSIPPGLSQAAAQMLEKPAAVPPQIGPNSPPEVVHDVQLMLKQFGYKLDSKEDKANVYGPSTRAAVTQFQKAHHLPETGIADLTTQAKMMEAVKALAQTRKDVFQALGSLNKLF